MCLAFSAECEPVLLILFYLFIFVCLFWGLCGAAYGVLVPQPGINPMSLQCRVLTTGPPGKSHILFILNPQGSINETWVFNEWRISNTMLVSEGARALESSLWVQTLSLPSRTRGVETPWSQRRQNWGLGSAVSWRCDPGHQTLVCKVGRTPASQSPYNFEY